MKHLLGKEKNISLKPHIFTNHYKDIVILNSLFSKFTYNSYGAVIQFHYGDETR